MTENVNVNLDENENKLEAYALYKCEYNDKDKTCVSDERLCIEFKEDMIKFAMELECNKYDNFKYGYDRTFLNNKHCVSYSNAEGKLVEIYYRKIVLEVID